MRFFLLLLFLFYSILTPLFSEEGPDEYEVSDTAWGLAHDGTNFWYSDPKRRAIFKIDPAGNKDIYNINLPKITGLAFDAREGRILVCSPKLIIKMEPNKGGITEKIPIPIEKIGGVASIGHYLYILDMENGKISIFDKGTGEFSGGIYTDRSAAKDIFFAKDSLWVTDSDEGNIFRYDIKTGKISGSVKSPGKDIRGVAFVANRLWVIDREEKKAKKLSFTETDRFIASLEREYSMDVELSFDLNEPTIAGGELAILHPPNTESQRIRNLEVQGEKYKSGLAVGDSRAFIRIFEAGDAPGNRVVHYSFTVKTQNIRYYITDDYMMKKEEFSSDLQAFIKFPEAGKGKDEITFLSKLYDARLYNSQFGELFDSLAKTGFPIRPAISINFDNKELKPYRTGYAFVKSYGWIPMNEVKAASGESSRSFVKPESTFDIVQSPNFDSVVSPVFYRRSQTSPWINLQSTIKLKIMEKK